MHIARRAILVGCFIFIGALMGDAVHWLLPKEHVADAKGTIGMIQGLVTLLLALVLGLLVWTGYGVYAQQKSEAQSLGSQILQLDLALERLGPQGAEGRELLREELVATRKRFWGHGDGVAAATLYAESRAELKSLEAFFSALRPAGDDERAAIGAARGLFGSLVQTHYMMARQLSNPIPRALIYSVVLWAFFLFACVGMSSTINALAVMIELLGAVSVASAIFLILEFSQPYFGFLRIPSDGIDQVIEALSTARRSG